MKIRNIYTVVAAIVMAMGLTGCDEEREFNVIEGNLPIKTSTLYMVGDATPNGWSIDDPTPLTPTEEDPLVFTWEGKLNKGEMKLCLTTGSWDAGFIRPENNGETISKTAVNGKKFVMYAGDPDNKWVVAEAGEYKLTFDLRNWTMSSEFLKDADAPVVEPIETDVLYMIGDATPGGWSLDDAQVFTVDASNKYIFTWEGKLTAGGTFKACVEKDFNAAFIRPSSSDVEVSENGVAAGDFVFEKNPDDQWKVTKTGIYRITFDLEHWTINVVYVSDADDEGGNDNGDKTPIETDVLYMIGDATPGGWSLDDAQVFTVDASNKYIFTWEGQLVAGGTFKACIEKDFNAPFIRPSSADVEVSSAGVTASDFVFVANPDDQWKVVESGNYRITFDLENWTINVEKL